MPIFGLQKDQLTLIAALVAAFGVIINTVLTLMNNRRAEYRSASRKILEEEIASLGTAFHEVIATSRILLKSTGEDNLKNWRAKARDAQESLKEIRPRVRYPLWGIDEGLKTLSKVPDWTNHLLINPEAANKLLDASDILVKQCDHAARKSYLKGQPPSLLTAWRIGKASKKVRKIYNSSMQKPNIAEIQSIDS